LRRSDGTPPGHPARQGAPPAAGGAVSTGTSRGDRAQPTSTGASRSPCQGVSLEVPGVELLVGHQVLAIPPGCGGVVCKPDPYIVDLTER